MGKVFKILNILNGLYKYFVNFRKYIHSIKVQLDNKYIYMILNINIIKYIYKYL